eukprot:6431365-Pyramimonas_sp.AAC.1
MLASIRSFTFRSDARWARLFCSEAVSSLDWWANFWSKPLLFLKVLNSSAIADSSWLFLRSRAGRICSAALMALAC